MSGYTYNEKEPMELCPYCGSECLADFADVGVGMVQCGPFHCENCHASQIGPYDEPRELSEREQKTGWYKPESQPGSSANVINGRVVTHREMDAAYRAEFAGNPLYEVPRAVGSWFEETRKLK